MLAVRHHAAMIISYVDGRGRANLIIRAIIRDG